MRHLITCPKCGKQGFFSYGDKTKVCQYEKCDGGEFEIAYTSELLHKIIKDLQLELSGWGKIKPVRAARERTLQKFLDGHVELI